MTKLAKNKYQIRRWKGNLNRAILDAASPFNNLGKLCEEYLTNSLDAFETVLYDNPRNNIQRSDCIIQFIIDKPNNRILFIDQHELMGMSALTIFENFFNLHGVNISRKRHINVRGKHGTGKSAAFGIKAEYLKVDSVFKSKRTTAISTYKSLKAKKPAILDTYRVDEDTTKPNGTTIEIKLPAKGGKKLTQLRSIVKAKEHIQKVFGKHLDKYNIEIIEKWKNKHDYIERIINQPRISVYERSYAVLPEIEFLLGPCTLIIKRAPLPIIDGTDQGINITSGGYTKEQTFFGLDDEPYANHFFGEWEIPKLDQYEGPNPPMQSIRDLRLNPENEMVQAIYAFGKEHLGSEIKKLQKDEKAKKQDERLQKLSKMANELANILNEDYAEYEEIRRRDKGTISKAKKEKSNSDIAVSTKLDESSTDISLVGKDINVEKTEANPTLSSGLDDGDFPAGSIGESNKPTEHHVGPLTASYREVDMPTGQKAQKRKRRKIRTGGGFRIEFTHPGHNIFIARFFESTKIISINMDSDIMVNHLKNCGNHEDEPAFKTFAYTMAIDEYARAVVNIKAANHEFAAMSNEEHLQEGVTEMGIIKKRVLDKLANIVT